jgi:BioD-like phosphotransacetylase family protein
MKVFRCLKSYSLNTNITIASKNLNTISIANIKIKNMGIEENKSGIEANLSSKNSTEKNLSPVRANAKSVKGSILARSCERLSFTKELIRIEAINAVETKRIVFISKFLAKSKRKTE